MHKKQKLDSEPQPLTPRVRAEKLLGKAEEQFERLIKGLVGRELSDVEDVTIGLFLVLGCDVYKQEQPIVISEGEAAVLKEKYNDRLMQRVSLGRDLGQCDFSAWLDPVRVDAYSTANEASARVARLCNSIDGPTINGYPVEMVEEVDGADQSATSSLVRLEETMRRLEESTIIKLPTTDAVA